ncbi:MAG: serine/threonine-protein kinase [Akkermansia sp.]
MDEMLDENSDEERLAELVEHYMERLRDGEQLNPRSFAAQYPELESELVGLLATLESVQDLSHQRASQAEDHAFPETLGGYRLLEKIGRGGMGTVFRAMQESLQREVAIKILAPSWNDDAHHREAFENESRLIASLRHTNIVEVFGAGQEGAYRYYVMGLVDGQELSPAAIRESFPPIPYTQAVAEVGMQAAKALAFAHTHGVLHRDVKPGNLLLDKQGVLHVTDFGLATVLNMGEDAPMVTMSNDGTLRYMAPERLLKGVSSYAVDQYALGLSLYELLTQKPAFAQSEPGQLVRRICEKPISPLQGFGELGAIINKSTSFEAAERYASMPDMVADLQRYLTGQPVLARRASLWRRYRMWMKRHQAVAIWSHAAALLLLLLWGTAAFAFWRVQDALNKENDQRVLAERNADVASEAMQRVFASMNLLSAGQDDESSSLILPSRADIQLMQDLLPYYVEISQQEASSASDVAAANQVLGSIALCAGDAEAAEGYFQTACNHLQPHDALYIDCVIGRAHALFQQRKPTKTKKAYDSLTQVVADNKDAQALEQRQRVLQCITLALRNAQRANKGVDREALLKVAGELLSAMAQADELPSQRRLMQASLLAMAPSPKLKKLISRDGTSVQELLLEVLEMEPTNEQAMRAYARLGLLNKGMPNIQQQAKNQGNAKQQAHRKEHEQNLLNEFKLCADYAKTLIAMRPDDLEGIYLYLSVRGRYTDFLSRMGETETAKMENERTLGVLSLLSSRADFSSELREKLALMVARRPGKANSADQREKELLVLMRNFDAKQSKELRQRINKVKAQARENRRRNAKHHRRNQERPRQRMEEADEMPFPPTPQENLVP